MHVSFQQERPLRAASWHSSQTGSQQDLMPEPQSEMEVPATQREADTQLPASPVTTRSESLAKETPASERSEPTPREGTNPAHSQPSEPGPSQPEAAEQAATRTQAQSKARPPAQSKAPPVTKTTQLEKPDTKARPNGKDTKDPKRTKPEPEDDDEYEAPVEDHPPPPLISKATLMKRLARICAPKADGTYKVPLEIIQTHKNLDTRDEVYRAFEKCGGDPVLPSRLLTVTNGTSARKAGSEGECTCIFFYV